MWLHSSLLKLSNDECSNIELLNKNVPQLHDLTLTFCHDITTGKVHCRTFILSMSRLHFHQSAKYAVVSHMIEYILIKCIWDM